MIMKKILISENRERAEKFIDSYEQIYLQSVKTVIGRVEAAGVKITSKEFLCDLISGNFDKFQTKYLSIATGDINSFVSQAARNQMRIDADRGLSEICTEIKNLFDKTLENRPMSDPFSSSSLT